MGYSLDLRPLQSVGYRQMGLVLQGLLKIDQAVEEMKQETRHLAKRQLTWFRQDHEIRWLHPETGKDAIHEAAQSFLRQ